MDIAYITPTARQCASKKPPRQFLCYLVNAFMDANGELLQYRHLMARPEYWVVWEKSYAK